MYSFMCVLILMTYVIRLALDAYMYYTTTLQRTPSVTTFKIEHTNIYDTCNYSYMMHYNVFRHAVIT